MMKRLKDSRLHRWPRVRSNRAKIVISAKLLTPFRMSFMRFCVIVPLVRIWRFVFALLIIEGLLRLAEIWTAFAYLPFDRMDTYGVMGALFLLYHGEQISGFALSRALLGKRLRIIITRDRVSVGGWLFKRRFSRARQLMFSVKPFDQATDEVYRRSQGFYMIIDDSRRVKLCEIFGVQAASDLVGNANMALLMETGDMSLCDLDINPARVRERARG